MEKRIRMSILLISFLWNNESDYSIKISEVEQLRLRAASCIEFTSHRTWKSQHSDKIICESDKATGTGQPETNSLTILWSLYNKLLLFVFPI